MLRKISFYILAFLLMLALAVYGRVEAGKQLVIKGSGNFAVGRILVQLNPSAVPHRDKLLATTGLQLIRQIPQLHINIIAVPAGEELAWAQRLAQRPEVCFAEPDYRYYALITPNDPQFPRQWNLRQINGPAGWDINQGSNQIVIAILDTGIDIGHPDLTDKIVAGYDFVNHDAQPQDDEGHGTHVAGIAAASSNNGTGVTSVDWNARIMPLKVLDDQGSGWASDISDAIRWATDHGANVINMSFGSSSPANSIASAINYAHQHNVTLVAAGGNEFSNGNQVSYPAAFPHVIAVAATNINNSHAFYSNTGPYVDIAAPGGDNNAQILSSIWRGTGAAYNTMIGTSMAAPHVSGLAALVKAQNPNLSTDQVEWAIESSARDLGAIGKDNVFGYGQIDVAAALRAADNLSPLPTPTPAPPTPTPWPADAYEPDNNCQQAKPITPGIVQHHNFNSAVDEDWVSFPITQPVNITLETSNLGTSGDTILELYSSDCQTRLGRDDDGGDGTASRITQAMTLTGTFYGRVLPYAETNTGGNSDYDLTMTSTISRTCLVQSQHPYSSNLDQTWVITNSDSSAVSSEVHFSRMELESDYDFLSLVDSQNNVVQRLTGTAGGFWSEPVPGQVVRLHMTSDDSVVGWGFCVDAIKTAGPAPTQNRVSILPPQANLPLGDVMAVTLTAAISGPVDSADLVLSFNPDLLTVVDANGQSVAAIQPTGPLTETLQNQVDNVRGSILFSAGRAPMAAAPSGEFDLATFYLQGRTPGRADLRFNTATAFYWQGTAIPNERHNGTYRVTALMNGQARLEGHSTAQQAGRPLRLWVGNGAATGPITTTIDESGFFTVPLQNHGLFTLTVKGEHSLSNQLPAVTLPTTTTMDFGVLKEGDANNDDRIIGADYSLLVTAYGSKPGNSLWNARCDFNDDSQIGIADFQLLVHNYGQAGPQNAASSVNTSPSSATLLLDSDRQAVQPGEMYTITVRLNSPTQPVDVADLRLTRSGPAWRPGNKMQIGSCLTIPLRQETAGDALLLSLGRPITQTNTTGSYILFQVPIRAPASAPAGEYQLSLAGSQLFYRGQEVTGFTPTLTVKVVNGYDFISFLPHLARNGK